MITILRSLSALLILSVGPIWGAAKSFPYGEPEHLKRYFIFVIFYVAVKLLASAIWWEFALEPSAERRKKAALPNTWIGAIFGFLARYSAITISALLTVFSIHFLRKEIDLTLFAILILGAATILASPWFPWRRGLSIRATLYGISALTLSLLSFGVLLLTLSWQSVLISFSSAFLFTSVEIGSLYATTYRELVNRKASKRLRLERLLRITKAQTLLLFLAPLTTVFLCVNNQLPVRYLLLLAPIPLIPRVHSNGMALAEELSSSKNPSLRQARRYYVETLSIAAIFFAIVAILGIV